jgi:HlyD family secretion protein
MLMKQLDRPILEELEAPFSTNGTLPPKRRPRRLRWIIAIAAVALVALVALWYFRFRAPASPALVTVPVQSGTLVQSITASGTVNPQDTIAVGSQVSGTIQEIDADFNSRVRKGQVLARLDPTPFQASLDQAQASLAQSQAQAQAAQSNAAGAGDSAAAARANEQAAQATLAAQQANATVARAAVDTADANVAKSQAALNLAQQTVQRDRSLIANGYISQSQLDTDQSNLAGAQAALTGAQVAARQAQLQASAGVSQAQAAGATAQSQAAQSAQSVSAAQGSLSTRDASVAAIGIQEAQVETARVNLEHTIITSPVDGTVIARTVSVGQTVAASFQTPTLFSIAKDLKKMEVDVAVGEPDIGGVRPGQPVDFTVLAFPGTTFHGIVSQVRQNPTTVQNVVTYDTVVLVDNKDGRLYPGMTANATVDVAQQKNALIVPLQALQWRPAGGGGGRRRGGATSGGASPSPGASGAPAQAGSQQGQSSSAASPWGQTDVAASATPTAGSDGRVFVQDKTGKLHRIAVQIDLVNSTDAAVEPVDDTQTLSAGDQVVVGSASASQRSGAQTSGVNGQFNARRSGLGAIH